MLAHGQQAAEATLLLGTGLLKKNVLDDRWRELVIVRTGILCGSAYEVHQHKRLALTVGATEEQLEALHDGPSSAVFTEQESAILHFTDEVVLKVKSGDSAFRALSPFLNHRALVELVLTIGYYMLISRFLENFEIDLEEQHPPTDALLPAASGRSVE